MHQDHIKTSDSYQFHARDDVWRTKLRNSNRTLLKETNIVFKEMNAFLRILLIGTLKVIPHLLSGGEAEYLSHSNFS